MPEIKPSVLRLSEFKSGLQDVRVHNDQENEIQRQMTPHDEGPKGYSAPSTPLSENGGHSVQEEKVRSFYVCYNKVLINIIILERFGSLQRFLTSFGW